MSLRRLTGNALASSSSTIVNAVFMFALYRLLTKELGIEQIGVWSLVVACASLARLGEFGIATSVSKFVAQDIGAGNARSAVTTITMSFVFVAAIVAICGLLVWPVCTYLLSKAIQSPQLLDTALSLLPWMITAAWLGALVNLCCATLDGYQRTTIRAIATITAGVFQLVIAYQLVPKLGIYAMGYLQTSHLILQLSMLIFGIYFVTRHSDKEWLSWSGTRMKAMLKYGSVMQVTAIGQLSFEPAVRWFLGVYGGLTITGYYELASKAIMQFRLGITSAFQMVVPFYATQIGKLGEQGADIQRAYRRTSRLLILISVPYFLLLACMLPYLFTLWTGSFSKTLIAVGYVCLIGWFINLLAVPAFMLYLAIGQLRSIAYTQLCIGILNLLFSVILGPAIGGMGVVIAAMSALSIGSLVVVYRFHVEYSVSVSALMPPSLSAFATIGLVACPATAIIAFNWRGQSAFPAELFLAAIIIGILLAWFSWRDPLRSEIWHSVKMRENSSRFQAS